MNDNDIIRLKHMLEAAKEAISFSEGRTRKDLNTDKGLIHILDWILLSANLE
jgi:uncharacterized protein with HEPN domain